MGRRSLATERRRQIAAVTIDCLAQRGYAETTLDRIANLAGMARGHMRHYVGNRDELLTVAARVFYFGEESVDETDHQRAARTRPLLSPHSTTEEALAYLFGDFIAPSSENHVAYAFFDAGRSIPAVHEITVLAYHGLQDALESILRREHPHTPQLIARRTAYAVLSIVIGTIFLLDIEVSDQRLRDARAAAQGAVRDLRIHR